MTTTKDKIVNIERLGNTDDNFQESVLLGDPGDQYQVKLVHGFQPDEKWNITEEDDEVLANGSGILIAINMPDEDDEDDDELKAKSELEDVLLALPAGWPVVPHFKKPNLWSYSSAVSPSVNQAVSRLELLQTAIEEWFHASEHELVPTDLPQDNTVSPSQRVWGEMTSPSDDLRSTSQSTMLSMSTNMSERGQLCVRGVGALLSSAAVEMALSGVEGDLPCLGADMVIDEVTTLLASLENERGYTRLRLLRERRRVTRLQKRIDDFCEWRLLNMGPAVQKEHASSMNDISELNWHVSYRGRLATRLRHKVEMMQGIIAKVDADIEFVQKQKPLVQEKLELEAACVDKIRRTKADVEEELQLTSKKSDHMLVKNEVVEEKVSVERAMMKAELDVVDQSLQQVSERMELLSMTHATFSQLSVDYSRKLTENAANLDHLKLTECRLWEEERNETSEIRVCQRRIRQLATDKKHMDDTIALTQLEMDNEYTNLLADENDRYASDVLACSDDDDCTTCTSHNTVYKDLLSTKRAQAAEERKLLLSIDRMEDTLSSLILSNRDVNMNTEDIYRKLKSSDTKKAASDKNYVRIVRDINAMDADSRAVATELDGARHDHTAATNSLMDEEQRTLMVEQKLRLISEELVIQLEDDMQSRNVIEARITVEQGQQEVLDEQLEMNTEKSSKLLDEVNKALAIVQDKVAKLSSIAKEKDNAISALQDEYRRAVDETALMHRKSEISIQQYEPIRETAKKRLSSLHTECHKIDTKTVLIRKKIEEMDGSTQMMNKSCDMSQKTIDELQIEIAEFDQQINLKMAIRDTAVTSLDETTERIRQLTACHEAQMAVRSIVLEKTMEQLVTSLVANKRLASRYRCLQFMNLNAKNRLVEKVGNQVFHEIRNLDMKNLHQLQQRMHLLAKLNYKKRGNDVLRQRFQLEASAMVNGMRATELHDTMRVHLDGLTDVLQTQQDNEARRTAELDAAQSASHHTALSRGTARLASLNTARTASLRTAQTASQYTTQTASLHSAQMVSQYSMQTESLQTAQSVSQHTTAQTAA